jgi:hypothetical protein
VIDESLVRTRYERASTLEDYLWLYDVGMPAVPSFKGVRNSFLLRSIVGLDTRAARRALEERCAAAEARMRSDPSDRAAARDFVALADVLGDHARLLAAFDALPPSDERRQAFGLRAFRLLSAQQRYADALTALPYGAMLSLVDDSLARLAREQDFEKADASRRIAAESIVSYIEALAGGGQAENAQALIARLRQHANSLETRTALRKALARAGRPDLSP